MRYHVEVLLAGYPGRSPEYGPLGWVTITLLKAPGQCILIEPGWNGIRPRLLRELAERQVSPADITAVLITHAHWDHMENWPLFPNAEIVLSRAEMAWALEQAVGTWHIPELHVRTLARDPRLHLVNPNEELWSGIRAHDTPGHTPGHLVYEVEGEEGTFLFTGDAAKTRAELISGEPATFMDEALARKSLKKILAISAHDPHITIVPGHDSPVIWQGGTWSWLMPRHASVEAWLGRNPAELTRRGLP